MRIDRRTKKTKKADPEVSSASPALGFVKKLVEETVTSCKDFHFAHVDSPKASITDTDFQEDPVLHSFFHYVKELKLTKELGGKEGEKAWVHYLCVVQSLYQYVPYHNKLHPGFILLNVLDWIKNGQTLAGKPVDEDDHFSHLEHNKVFVSSSAIALAVSVLNHDIAHPGYAVFGPGDAQTTEPFKYFYNESNFQQEPEKEGDYPKPLIKGMFLELGHGLFAVEILEQFKEQLPGTFGKRVENSAKEIEKIKGYYNKKVLELEEFNWVLDRLDYGKTKNPGERPVVMNIYQTILMTAVGASKPIITKWSNDEIKNKHVTHGEIALSSLLMKAADLSIPFAKDEHTRFVLSSFVNVEFVKKDDEKKPAPELARSISGGQGYFKNGIGEPFFKLAEKLLFNEKAKIAGEDVVPGFTKTQDQILKGLGTLNKKGEIVVDGNPERQKLFKKIFDAAGKLRERSPKVKNTFAGDDEQKKAYAKMVTELKKRRG